MKRNNNNLSLPLKRKVPLIKILSRNPFIFHFLKNDTNGYHILICTDFNALVMYVFGLAMSAKLYGFIRIRILSDKVTNPRIAISYGRTVRSSKEDSFVRDYLLQPITWLIGLWLQPVGRLKYWMIINDIGSSRISQRIPRTVSKKFWKYLSLHSWYFASGMTDFLSQQTKKYKLFFKE